MPTAARSRAAVGTALAAAALAAGTGVTATPAQPDPRRRALALGHARPRRGSRLVPGARTERGDAWPPRGSGPSVPPSSSTPPGSPRGRPTAISGGIHSDGAPAVTGVGHVSAAEIWYRPLTVHMTSNTDYNGARTASFSAAKDLYGATSAQYKAVNAARAAVNAGPRLGS